MNQREMVTTKDMDSGAVAFLDVLGFRGIWERYSPAQVVKRLELLQTGYRLNIPSAASWIPGGHLSFSSKAAFLSDTVIVTCCHSKSIDEEFKPFVTFGCLSHVLLAANAIQHSSLLKEPFFVFRGCVAFGDLLTSQVGDFVVGPAIDEAAYGERLADGAFVWLSDSASRIWSELWQSGLLQAILHPDELGQLPLLDFEVPMKDGSRPLKKVVMPLSNLPLGGSSETLQGNFLSTFQPLTADIDKKRRNSKALLDATVAHIATHPFKV